MLDFAACRIFLAPRRNRAKTTQTVCAPSARYSRDRRGNGSGTMEQMTVILQRLNRSGLLPSQHLQLTRQTLAEFVATPDCLNRMKLERRFGGFARTFICGDEHSSVWAMTWAPGASTPVHDHHCSCCFAVLAGAIREVWFDAIDGCRAVKTAEHDRLPGFVAAMMPASPNIHQMINAGNEEAISIHVYGYDHRIHASSIDREYRIENR